MVVMVLIGTTVVVHCNGSYGIGTTVIVIIKQLSTTELGNI